MFLKMFIGDIFSSIYEEFVFFSGVYSTELDPIGLQQFTQVLFW